MSVSRYAALLLAVSTTAASAGPSVKCPRLMMGDDGTVHTLAGGRVFQGAADKKAELTPVHGNYDIAALQGAGAHDPLNLVCVYGGTEETKTVEIPRDATSCDVSDAGSGTVAGCH